MQSEPREATCSRGVDQARVASALVELAAEAGDSLDLGEVLGAICRLSTTLVPCHRCSVYLWSERRAAYVPVADWGTPPAVAAQFAQVYYYRGAIRYEQELARGRMVVLSRDHADPDTIRELDAAALHALAVVPLVARGRTLGSVTVGLHEPPGFAPTQLRIIEGIGRQAAQLIDKARLFRRVEKASALRARLGELAARLSTEHDAATIGRLVCADGARLFGVADGILLLRQGERLVASAAAGPAAEASASVTIPLADERGPVVRALGERRPLFFNDLDGASRGHPDVPAALEPKSLLVIPLLGRDGPFGCLVYADLEDRRRFGEETTEEAGLLGAMTAAALERAQLFGDLLRSNAALEQSREHFRALFIERKETEDALRESEERTRLIVETAHDALVTIDAAGTITGWNGQAEKTFGWSRDEVLGRQLSEIIIPDRYREAHQRGLAHFLATGEGPVLNRRIEITALDRAGREFPVELAVWPMPMGGSFAFGAFIHDITERRQSTEALEQARRQAEEQAHQLQAQAAELVEARDQALASTRAKSEFLANMSHEIRTPMNGIFGMTGLLLETDLTDEQREFAVTVRRSADALLTIVNDVLDFSKIEAGKMTIEVHDFNLRVALEEVAELFALRAHEKGIELACDIAPDLPVELRGDCGRLRQIMANLVANAVKFTEAGEVILSATARYHTRTHVTVRVAVTDSGIGIPPERHADIFQSFTQVDGSNTRKYGGTGLGLAICRQLTELMGGEIGLASEPGRGSRFWVDLAFECQHVTAASPRLPDSLSGKRVLVVDDNATNRLVLNRQLSSWGLAPVEASSGGEALAVLAASAAAPIALVLLDLQMPDWDGEETARRIKADPRSAGIPLVLLSSVGRQESAGALRLKGFVASLPKPVRQSSLYNLLAEVLGAAPAAASAGTSRFAPVGRADLGLRILVAEDNVVNQKVAIHMLERWGCTADAVVNGREALAALAQRRYDLVLMDLQMPEMDGVEATAAIRQAEAASGRRTPIVAMTAHALAGDRERCLAADMDDYVAKPVKPDDLLRAISRWQRPRCAPPQDAASSARGAARDGALAGLLSGLGSLGGEALGALGEQLSLLMSRRELAAASDALRHARAQLERLRTALRESASARLGR